MNNYFIAKGEKDGEKTLIRFDKSEFNEERATELLNSNDVKNFLFYFEPNKPIELDENTVLFSGEVGFDITLDILLPYIKANKVIALNSGGGYNSDATLIHDLVKDFYPETKMLVMGNCFSATNQIFLAAKYENRQATQHSKFLIHNGWVTMDGDHNQLRNVANMLEKETNTMIDLYMRVSEKPRAEIVSLMDAEAMLSVSDALDLKFISSVRNNETKALQTEKTQESEDSISNINNKKMTEEQKKGLNLIEKLGQELKNLFNPVKNVIVQTNEGIEVEFPEVESADLIKVGDKATAGGSAATGEHVMPSGETYVFEAGELIEIKPAMEEEAEASVEVEALNAEIVNLKKELSEVKNLLTKKDSSIAEMKADFEVKENDFKTRAEEIQTKIKEINGTFVENKADDKTPVENKTNEKKPVSINMDKVKKGVTLR